MPGTFFCPLLQCESILEPEVSQGAAMCMKLSRFVPQLVPNLLLWVEGSEVYHPVVPVMRL